jgi:hypothetical protein
MKTESKIVAIQELLWTYHPLPKDVKIVSFDNKKEIDSADILLQTNIKGGKREKKLGNIYQYVIDSGKPFICVESAVFRKNMPTPPNPMAYHRWSWTSYFRDEGDYCNKNSPRDRWEKIQKNQDIKIKPWKTTGNYVLLVMQRPGDTSLKNLISRFGDYKSFISYTIKNIRKNTNRPIRVRMHPLRSDIQKKILEEMNVDNIEISNNTDGASLLEGGNGLQKDFDNAYAVVGFNSNALTESACEGIPTFSMCPSSMAWDVSNKSLEYLENPITFERQQWLNDLGYCQWNEEECREGLPLIHLLKRYE